MSNEPIALTDRDRDRLVEMVDTMRTRCDRDTAQLLDTLEKEVLRARIVPSEEAEPNVVTMNSKVKFHDIDMGKKLVYTVTWPHLADTEERKVSVLAPIGMALLGTRVGQVIEWQVPMGKRRLKVDKILFQPESKGVLDA